MGIVTFLIEASDPLDDHPLLRDATRRGGGAET